MRPYLTLMAKMELLLELRDSVHARFVAVRPLLRLSTLNIFLFSDRLGHVVPSNPFYTPIFIPLLYFHVNSCSM